MTDTPREDVTGEEPVQADGSFPASPEDPMAAETDVGLEEAVATGDVRIDELEAQLAERTLDLQRLQAEYVNYKRRVDRDREQVLQNATYSALAPITEVMDTIDRAREHGELEGGFKAVAEQLERILAGVGLVKFGAVGDAFDPTIHEALSHIGEDPDVTVTTCKVIAKAGYRIGDRVVRAAQVLVVDPAADGPATATEPADAAQPAEAAATAENADPAAADVPREDQQDQPDQ
ncbi:nucleotide exchange factor GrpE [Nocardioides halotolerans]|uniref:nucleotide exchange factor GrpE n=1 Tax=Nocardioides halotolerans TaxID=433660 RepID=UPI000429055D|nr:nucleotide exchange factor GrpE [Nocardioides halotolerans]